MTPHLAKGVIGKEKKGSEAWNWGTEFIQAART